MIRDVVISLLLLIGAFFMLVAALGVLRMPDLLIRLHASTKAGVLGTSLLVTSVALAYQETSVTVRCLAIVMFICVTAPVVAHVVGRAAYFASDIRLWESTTIMEVPRDLEQTGE